MNDYPPSPYPASPTPVTTTPGHGPTAFTGANLDHIAGIGVALACLGALVVLLFKKRGELFR